MSFAPLSSEMPENHETRPSNQEETVLESDLSLSHSLIWRRQREFYVQRGMRAWSEDLVPNFQTNNPFIAGVYARIAFSFLCDCMKLEGHRPALSPIRILELGSGPGKFAYLLLLYR